MAKQTLNDNAKGVEITTSDAEALESYIRSKAKEVLDSGVTIKEVAGKAASFDISRGADYKINVSKEAFTKYFIEFMRPRMREILFGEKRTRNLIEEGQTMSEYYTLGAQLPMLKKGRLSQSCPYQ